MDIFKHQSDISDFSDEEFYHLCFTFSTDIIFLLNRDMKIMRVSPSVERILGFTPEECTGFTFDKINGLSTEETLVFIREFCAFFSGDKMDTCEFRCHTRNGVNIVLELTGVPLLRKGEINGAVISARDITRQKKYEEEVQDVLGNLRKSLDVTIKTITRTVDSRDPYTSGHHQRVADLARAIATEMGLDEDAINGIRMAGIIHDIGKISIPSEILSKPGRLHSAEFELIKCHPKIGFDILSTIDFPWPVAAIVLQHHERINGSGYPFSITGKHIMPEAKIVAVADVVEALATHRPYRASIGIDEALNEIKNNSGKLYCKDVVSACVHLFDDNGYELMN